MSFFTQLLSRFSVVDSTDSKKFSSVGRGELVSGDEDRRAFRGGGRLLGTDNDVDIAWSILESKSIASPIDVGISMIQPRFSKYGIVTL